MPGRAIPEWIGRSADSAIPPRVQRRVFDRFDGRCYLTGAEIDPVRDEWQIEHVVALCNGGENRENNLAPALVEPHKIKTRADMKAKARSARVRNKHLGITGRKWRPLAGTVASGWRKRMNGTAERRAR